MLEVTDARRQVLQEIQPLLPICAALDPSVIGQVLAEPVNAREDSPPFTKSAMDGYAVPWGPADENRESWKLVGEVAAGQKLEKLVHPGETVRIFTGAPLPAGCNTVIRQEDVLHAEENHVRFLHRPVKSGHNVIQCGQEMKTGEIVLRANTLLTPVVLGLLATLGRNSASVIPRPRIGILATGDELVEAGEIKTDQQIYNSNGPMLASLVQASGGVPVYFGIVNDDPAKLREQLFAAIEQCSLILLAGGVSVGKYDHVPGVIADLGAQIYFRQVRMKPGKPFLFAKRGQTLIMGLPGNPVSTRVCYELFVKPAIEKLLGYPTGDLEFASMKIATALNATNDRPTFYPARLESTHHGTPVVPLPWFGSADLRALLTAEALIYLPAGKVDLSTGQSVEVLKLSS